MRHMADDTEADFAVAVYREDGRWQAVALPPRAATSLETLLHGLRQQPGEGGVLGLVSVADDFFIVIRINGGQVRLLLSDATAADEWALAEDVLDALDEPLPETDDDAGAAGDLALLTDLGMDGLELEAVCDDDELYPDEQLGAIATRLGCLEQFEEAIDVAARR